MKSPKEFLKQWIQRVNDHDVRAVVALYDKTAVLLPTFSNIVLNTPKKIRDYFKILEAREKLSVTLHKNTLSIQPIHHYIFTLHGIYNWRFKVDGELLNFEARFSYVIDLARPHPILHHHSSQIPRML